MKVKITRPDGTTIEAEGTAEEIERIAGKPAPQLVPFISYPPIYYTQPPAPAYPPVFYPWEITCTGSAS